MNSPCRALALLVVLTAAMRAQWAGELVNLSARLRVAAGPTPVIAGTVLTGAGTQTLLVRAVGPGLAGFGVTGTMADPRLTVFDSAGRAMAANDNWESEASGAAVRDAAAGAGAFALAAGSRDAAVLVRVAAGPMTVHVVGADGGGGVVLLELYTVGATAVRLVNLSIRAAAGIGSDTLTAGFVIRNGVLPLVVRGIGPTLAQFGVAGAAADPSLTVLNGSGATLGTNDNWDAAGTSSFMRQAAAEAGAFALPASSKDAAVLVSLGSGAYTAQVANGAGAAGQALIEVYATQPDAAEINGALRGQPGNIQDNTFQSLTIDPRDSNTVYLGTETSGILKTADGGVTWTRLRKGLRLDVNRLSYPQIFEITVDPDRPGTLYAATVAAPGPATGSGVEVLRSGIGGVYKSTDGGLNWQQRIDGFINTYTPHVVLSPRDSRVLYAGIGGVTSFGVFYDGGLLVSRDGAGAWQQIVPPPGTPKNTPIGMLATLKGAVETLYVSFMVHGADQPTAFGFYASADAGRTWEARNPPGLVLQNFDAFAQDNALLYANDDSAKRIHKSTDGGRIWTRTAIGNFGPIKISPVDANTIVFTGFTTLMKSSDGAATMKVVLDDTAFLGPRQFTDLKFSRSNPAVVWAAAKGYILYKSTDGGEKFVRVTGVRDAIYGSGN